MIAILLEDLPFEQDIRELFMAFYPGEEYTYTPGKKAIIVFEGKRKKETYDICLRFFDSEFPIEKKWACSIYPDRLDTKNEIKRKLYEILSDLTKKTLPWGTLTGIRPTKLVMEMLEEGKGKEEIRSTFKTRYKLSEKKTNLVLDTALREKEILDRLSYEKGWSLYIGIPFCPTTCAYCSFTSYPISAWKKKKTQYIAALCSEIREMAKLMRGRRLQCIYMGGGTPTSLEAEDIEVILKEIKESLDLSHLLEYCVEAGRPDSITEDKLKVLKNYGVRRISINPQSMNQKTLDIIGRKHTVESVEDVYQRAFDIGFENINMDLILGLPQEKAEDVKTTFERIKKLSPKSVTVHSLAIKRAARLNTEVEKLKYIRESEIEITKMNEIAVAACADMGLSPYYLYRQKNMAGNNENVGYAVPGYECIYNILIMEEKQSIIACGAGASSKFVWNKENRVERAENVKDPDLYIQRIEEMMERKKTLAKSAFNM